MALTKVTKDVSSTPGIVDNSNATAITIDSSERVGIVDTTPDALLKVETTSTAIAGSWIRGGSYGLRVSAGSTSSHYALRVANGSDSDLMTVNGDGKVGIGTSSPDVMLDVRGEVAVDYNASHGLRFYNQARNNWSSIGNRDTGTGADLQFKTGNATALNLNHGGDLTHMGTSAFTAGVTSFRKRNLNSVDLAEVAVGGGYAANDTFIVYDTTNNATRFKVTYQGTIWATNTTIQQLSDERFKENIRDLDKGLADILKLKPRRFDWIAEEGSGRKNMSGFVAQECEAAGFEEFVDTTDFNEANKNLKSFGQSGLIPALVKSIQELSTKLEAAEARITTLEG